ncbi:MAG: hypothetical protein A2X25_00070 [Chloroflexi bacterium GWB2_49_20]|nr:MAG: hypothetical protein A2X25_00070 [Chloroflexi bacterium GWB2_49_20]OGN76937.1 MAG: hypothetical protein A2X26_13495 [Chloroflexi bacterium GWC2_49_37]OGN84867.1 MAG: hypothetical protein A2X27_14960 [Chloroflexi bacterium GWD2_49_16]
MSYISRPGGASMSTPSTALSQLFEDHWQAWMQYDPLFASMCGDNRYDDRLPSSSDASFADWRGQLQAFRQRQDAIPCDALSPADQLNYDIFARLLDGEIDELGHHYYRLPISRTAGFHMSLPDLPLLMSMTNQRDYENYISRLKAVHAYFADNIELMRLGMSSGYLPALVTLEGIEAGLEPHILEDPTHSIFFKPFEQFPSGVGESQRERLARSAQEAIRTSVIPAYRELLKFVQEEYRPAARPGIAACELPRGHAFYLSRIRYFTSLELTPDQVHATGQGEVRRIRTEMQSVVQKSGFKGDFKGYIEYLRSEPRFYASTPEALLKETALVLKRIDGELPRLSYGIRTIPDFSAPGNTTAYYMPGSGDGTRAGYYYVNTYDLKSRPFYEIEALSLHEAVPGHHLQIALQQELTGLPSFRRFSGFTSFVEGWALYSERLGLEMGFYQDPASDFGRLSYEMWRACRLVVDTGMHALGWSRQQAIDFMLENTSSTELNIINEVDRYIAWPGQALAYKIGELKIRELRAYAESRLGERFNLREFHDVILLAGAVPLDVLEQRVREWVVGQA